MAYKVLDVTRLPFAAPEIGRADTLEGAEKVALDYLAAIYGNRPYKVFSERDTVDDGLDMLASAGSMDCTQIAVNSL